MNCKICALDKISQYILHGSKTQRSKSRRRGWNGEEWEREVSFRVELLNVDSVDEGLNLIIFYCVWDENILYFKNCFMGLCNWTKLHFTWRKTWFSYNHPTVAFLMIKIIFWIAAIINWNCSAYKWIGSTDFDSHPSHELSSAFLKSAVFCDSFFSHHLYLRLILKE